MQAVGFTLVHDKMFNPGGQLLRAASCYEVPVERRQMHQPRRLVPPTPRDWPWGWVAWKPRTRLDDLVRAGALYQAEADRVRASKRRAAAELCEEHRDRCAAALDRLLTAVPV